MLVLIAYQVRAGIANRARFREPRAKRAISAVTAAVAVVPQKTSVAKEISHQHRTAPPSLTDRASEEGNQRDPAAAPSVATKRAALVATVGRICQT